MTQIPGDGEPLINVEKFVKSLRSRRKDLGLSQSDLAGLCGLSTEGLSKIERGDSEPKLATVLRLIKLLGGALYVQWKQK